MHSNSLGPIKRTFLYADKLYNLWIAARMVEKQISNHCNLSMETPQSVHGDRKKQSILIQWFLTS